MQRPLPARCAEWGRNMCAGGGDPWAVWMGWSEGGGEGEGWSCGVVLLLL